MRDNFNYPYKPNKNKGKHKVAALVETEQKQAPPEPAPEPAPATAPVSTTTTDQPPPPSTAQGQWVYNPPPPPAGPPPAGNGGGTSFSFNGQAPPAHARWVPDPTVQVGDLAGERSAILIENQRREIEHLKLQRENAQMRATLAEQSSGSHRGGSVKSIPDMVGDGY